MKDSFNELTYEELLTKREEMNKNYRKICYDKVLGHVENTVQKRIVRRKIARINCLIHEFKLGVRKARS